MTDNPITKKITRKVHGYWPARPRMRADDTGRTWTLGELQNVIDDCRAAGYGDDTELKPEMDRGLQLRGFRLERTEPIADEIPVQP